MMDRAERNGTGMALLFHVAIIGALSTSLAHIKAPPEPPSMDVEFVDEVAAEAAAPTPIPTPAPAEQSPVVEPVPPMDQPVPAPPPPTPRASPTPAPTPKPVPRQVSRPAPPRPSPPAKAPAKPAPRKSILGDDFLKGIPDGAKSDVPAKPSAAKYDAEAKANVAALISRQIRPCADRQVRIGSGAERLRVVVDLQLLPNGRLKGAPDVVRVDGLDDENSRFQDLAVDQAIATYRQCSPLRLPAELYSTPTGGWSSIRLRYQVK